QLKEGLKQIIPTPTLPDPGDVIPKDPKPEPEPTVEEPDPGGGGGGDDGSGDSDDGSGSPASGAVNEDKPGGKQASKGDGDSRRNGGRGDSGPVYDGTYVPMGGSFTTDRLVAVATRLRSLNVPTTKVVRKVFAPFIIGGRAAWQDTWGAPRYGPGSLVRTHEGQDVFCTYGDPVLATETGRINYGDGGLGGKVARLYRVDGSYWYYAHLSGWNTQEFPNGSVVHAGDIIGYCGNTGNAISTPSHVHFGWYRFTGDSKNPMRDLVGWLHTAERRALGEVSRAQGKQVRQIESLTLARRFGDAFMPDLTTREESSAAILTAGDVTGAFDLAQATIMAALAGNEFETGDDPAAATFTSTGPGLDGQLDAILEQSQVAGSTAGE
ncbi:MAG: M23 family metallopeptidase, partial [Actinomycetota bacterium]